MSEPRPHHGLRLERYTVAPLVHDPPETPEETALRLQREVEACAERVEYDEELTQRVEADWLRLLEGRKNAIRIEPPVWQYKPLWKLPHLTHREKFAGLLLFLVPWVIFALCALFGRPRP